MNHSIHHSCVLWWDCVWASERARTIEQRETEALGNNDKNFGREKLIFNVSDKRGNADGVA